VMRKTIGKRMAAKLKGIEAELRKRMHEPIRGTGEWLRAVVRGYYIYHAVPGNFSRLRSFRHDVKHSWWQAVRRRGQRVLRREVFDRIVAQYLPTPVILHPYPLERFSAKHPRQEPCALTLTSARTGPCGGWRATGIPAAISGTSVPPRRTQVRRCKLKLAPQGRQNRSLCQPEQRGDTCQRQARQQA
jgi:hypothetical protein